MLLATDAFGQHPWYQAQSLERQIEIGTWRQANVAKVGLHFESILIRGPDELRVLGAQRLSGVSLPPARVGSKSANHTMMFQEMVNHIGWTSSVCRACLGGSRH